MVNTRNFLSAYEKNTFNLKKDADFFFLKPRPHIFPDFPEEQPLPRDI